MALKQSVVVVNEYTVKGKDGSGSRGSTPGAYVTEYMARVGAVETVTPVRLDDEPFLERYVSRDGIAEDSDPGPGMKRRIHAAQGYGGVAFGYGSFSMSDKEFRAASRDIQAMFDEGKTVLKTVISFDEAYLRKHGLVPEDFRFVREGDYRGNVDQLKLRMAIMEGLDRMSGAYDDLQYVGVLQLDTEHVHCHLAMVDRGRGNLAKDGTQVGKISERSKRLLRAGIDSFLEEKQPVRMMSANTDYDRRNVICFVKREAYRVLDQRGFAQFLMACLPDDRTAWRADTEREDMRKADAVVREYVGQLLEMPDSGYREAMARADEYARNRMAMGNLTGEEYRTLSAEARRHVVDACVDAVYSVLLDVPEEEFNVTTPLMSAMAMPYESMADAAGSDPMVEFGFKLRSYKSRMDHHMGERRRYHEAAAEYKRAMDDGSADPTSRPLYDFFLLEEEYNAMLASKYRHFLDFIPPEEEYMEGFQDLADYRERVRATRRMRNDRYMRTLKQRQAEDYGMRVYGEDGGRYVVSNPSVLDERVARMEETLREMEDDYRMRLSEYGMVPGEDGRPVHVPEYGFDEVKALDLHHLAYDFPYDFAISADNARSFVEMADRRYAAFAAARDYLISTGQGDAVASALPVSDIEVQHREADRYRDEPVLRTKREADKAMRLQTHTISMDSDFYDREDEIKKLVQGTINSLQYEFE